MIRRRPPAGGRPAPGRSPSARCRSGGSGCPGAGGRHDDLSRHDERFLVRESEVLPGVNRGQRRDEAGRPDDGGNDQIGLRMSGRPDEPFDPADDFGAVADEPSEGWNGVGRGEGDERGPVPVRLFGQEVQVPPGGGEGGDAEAAGTAGDDVEGRDADRSGGAEERNLFHPFDLIQLSGETPMENGSTACPAAGENSRLKIEN